MADKRIASAVAAKLESLTKDRARSPLTGPGADRVRRAQSIIRWLAGLPLRTQSIRGAVRYRPNNSKASSGGVETSFEPAILPTPARMKASTGRILEGGIATSMRAWCREFQRARAALEPLVERLRAGEPLSLGERARARFFETAIQGLMADTTDVPFSSESRRESGKAPTPPQDSHNDDVLQTIRDIVQKRLAPHSPESVLRPAHWGMPEPATHDFVRYVYLRKPRSVVEAHFPGDASTTAALEQFLARTYEIIQSIVYASPPTSLSSEGSLSPSEYVGGGWNTPVVGDGSTIVEDPYLADLLVEILYRRFLSHVGSALYERQKRLDPDSEGDMLSAFREWLVVVYSTASWDQDSINNSYDNPALWDAAYDQIISLFAQMYPGARFRPRVDDTDEQYSFVPFSGDLINFGLRLVYRQEWQPLGTQPGELVRTIPLGPKQTERVMTKTVVNDRITRDVETLTVPEGAAESANSVEESTGIVSEASRRLTDRCIES